LPLLKFMCVTQVFYLLLPTFLFFIFFFNYSPSFSLFLVSVFSICFSQYSFLSFFLKIISFISTLALAYFLLEHFAVFLRHWFSWFLFFMRFLSPFSLTCSMLFFYNMIYATCFIFFLCKFFNDLHFSYLKFFIAISPCFFISSIACETKHTLFSLFIILQAQCFWKLSWLYWFFIRPFDLYLIFFLILLFFPSLTFYTHLVFCFLNFASVQASLFLFMIFLCLFSLFLTLFSLRFSLPFYFPIFLYQFPMVNVCGPSFKRICL